MSNDEPLTLKRVAQAALDNTRGRSGREWDRYMKDERKLDIVYTTVNNMAGGRYMSRPKEGTLQALSKLSGYSIEQVREAAKAPQPLKPLRDDLPPDADLLTGPQRRAVIDAIRLFAQQNKEIAELRREQKGGGSGDSGGSPTTNEPGAGPGNNVTNLPTRAAPQRRRPAARREGRPPKGDPKHLDD